MDIGTDFAVPCAVLAETGENWSGRFRFRGLACEDFARAGVAAKMAIPATSHGLTIIVDAPVVRVSALQTFKQLDISRMAEVPPLASKSAGLLC